MALTSDFDDFHRFSYDKVQPNSDFLQETDVNFQFLGTLVLGFLIQSICLEMMHMHFGYVLLVAQLETSVTCFHFLFLFWP